MKLHHAVAGMCVVVVAFGVAACTPGPTETPISTTTSTTASSTTTTSTTVPVTPAGPLTGTFSSSLPPATITSGTCNNAGDSTFTFTISGTTTAPYAGTFTETGTVTIGAQTEEFLPGQFRGPITAFSSTFTITSANGDVTGTKALVPGNPADVGACITGLDTGAQILVSSLSYDAEIHRTDGTYVDEGTTWVNANMYGTPTANSSSLQYRSNFNSTGFGPAAAAVTLAGTVFEDLAGHGLQNSSGDVAIAGRTVTVYADADASGTYSSGDTVAATLVTDALGAFTTQQSPGDYVVCESLPADWLVTAPSGAVCAGAPGAAASGHAVALDASTPPVTFANFETSIWRAGVFHDLDADGVRDNAEPFLGGWILTVYDDADRDGVVDPGEAVLESDATSAQMTGVDYRMPPGQHIMCATPQAGWAQTRPTNTRCTAVSADPGGFLTIAQSGGYGNDYFFGYTPA